MGTVFVRVLRVGALVSLGLKFGIRLLEGIGNLLEEDEAQYDVLVFGGVHAASEGVGHAPKFGFVTHESVAIRCGPHV